MFVYVTGCVCARVQVKVAVVVEKLANHRTEMVYKIVSPPFHEMPVLDGRSYVDPDSDVDTGVKEEEAAAGKADKKRKKKAKGERPAKKQKD